MPNLPLGILLALLASMAYGVLFSVPRRALLGSGVAGALGWLGYAGLLHATRSGVSAPVAAFLGSALVAISAEILARALRHPATVFIVPGIIPLVPGAAAYETMLLFLQGRTSEGLRMALDTAFFAGGVAAGLLTMGSSFRAAKLRRRR